MMRILTVTPITQGIGKEALSYYSLKDVAVGSIVRVPLRKRMVSALVVGSKNAGALKTKIRKAGFQMRKIEDFLIRLFCKL